MPQLTGAWTRFATKAIPRYAEALTPAMYHIHASEVINRAAELAAWEAIRIADLPGYTGEMLEVAKDLRAIKEERDGQKAGSEALQLREVDEGQILRLYPISTTPGVGEVGSDSAG